MRWSSIPAGRRTSPTASSIARKLKFLGGRPSETTAACFSRSEPLTQKIERYVSYGFANPHGRVFDRWGNDIITDATGNENFFGPAFSGYLPYPQKHNGMPQFWARPNRPCPGTGMISS